MLFKWLPRQPDLSLIHKINELARRALTDAVRNWKNSDELLQEAYNLAERSRSMCAIATVEIAISKVLLCRGKFGEAALRAQSAATRVKTTDHALLAEAYNLIGLAHLNSGQYLDAIQAFHRTRGLDNDSATRFHICAATINEAASYRRLGRLDNAMQLIRMVQDDSCLKINPQLSFHWFTENAIILEGIDRLLDGSHPELWTKARGSFLFAASLGPKDTIYRMQCGEMYRIALKAAQFRNDVWFGLAMMGYYRSGPSPATACEFHCLPPPLARLERSLSGSNVSLIALHLDEQALFAFLVAPSFHECHFLKEPDVDAIATELVRGWYTACQDVRRLPTSSALSCAIGALDKLTRLLREILQRAETSSTSRELMATISRVKGRLIYVPHRYYGIIPFEALIRTSDNSDVGADSTGEALPEAIVARDIFNLDESVFVELPEIQRFLVLYDPGIQGKNMPLDVLAIRKGPWAVTELNTRETTVAQLSQELRRHDAIHFAAHSSFRSSRDEHPTIQLADGELQSSIVRAVRLDHLRLAILATCDSSLPDIYWTDADFGMADAFLDAGCRLVMAFSWPAHDFSTQLLLARFYENLLARKSSPAALREAKQWLRSLRWRSVKHEVARFAGSSSSVAYGQFVVENDLAKESSNATPYGHPYYWAGANLMIGSSRQRESHGEVDN